MPQMAIAAGIPPEYVLLEEVGACRKMKGRHLCRRREPDPRSWTAWRYRLSGRVVGLENKGIKVITLLE